MTGGRLGGQSMSVGDGDALAAQVVEEAVTATCLHRRLHVGRRTSVPLASVIAWLNSSGVAERTLRCRRRSPGCADDS